MTIERNNYQPMKSRTVLIAGVGRIPIGNPDKVYAPGLRLFAFSKILHNSGYRVIMGEADFEKQPGGQQKIPEKEILKEGWERRRLPLETVKAAALLSRWIAEEKPKAAISTTDVTNLALSMAHTDVPTWMDFNGHPMVERQEIGYIHDCDEGLLDQWLFILPSLLSGDHFSTCSTPQKHALIGELGVVGRLNRLTSGHELVSSLPPGPVLHEPRPDGRVAFRGRDVPKDAFCLLWTGGFNTWVDEKTLFLGVEKAMAEIDRLQFILTGGEIRGHDEKTFSRFRGRVEKSPFRDRFHFYGWVPMKDLPNFYHEADVAINIDRFTYEAILGCRNRVFSWIHYRLPILTTPLSEITAKLVSNKMAIGFPPGDISALAERLSYVQKNTQDINDMTNRAYRFLHEQYTYENLLKPLLNWLEKPGRAPDRKPEHLYRVKDGPWKGLEVPDNPLTKSSILRVSSGREKRELKERLDAAEDRLRRLEGSRAVRMAEKIRRILRRTER